MVGNVFSKSSLCPSISGFELEMPRSGYPCERIETRKEIMQENQNFFQVVMMVKILSSKVSKKGVGINEWLLDKK